MIIYVDSVCFENMVINFIILELTGIFTKDRRFFFRVLVSSFFGSLFAVFSLVIRLNFLLSILIKIIVSCVMILIAFKGRRNFLKKLTFFYLVTFVLGGVCFALMYLSNPAGMYISNGVLVSDYSFVNIFSYIFIAICFTKLVCFFFKSRQERKDLICDLEISIDGKIVKLRVLMDTGNLLREPCTGKPVVIVEKSFLKEAFDVDFFEKAFEKNDNDFGSRFYVIPYSSLGNESGALIGISCDFVRVFWEEEVCMHDVVIGLYEGRLSSVGRYNGLVGNFIK